MTIHDELIAAGLPVSGTAIEGQTVLFTRPLTEAETDILDSIVNKPKYRSDHAIDYVRAIPNWATWTQAEFDTWCGSNLMTDADIDATTLSAALKKNIKANNAFTRNAGKMIIAFRNRIWPSL